jgi:hypothetical protein
VEHAGQRGGVELGDVVQPHSGAAEDRDVGYGRGQVGAARPITVDP